MPRRLHRGFAVVALVLPLLAAAAPDADWCRIDDPVSWRAQGGETCAPIADPHALPVELALPLPCGRYGVFRRVVVPATSVLDHATIWMGAAGEESAGSELGQVVNAPRKTELAGGFTVDGDGKPLTARERVNWDKVAGRAYYIGKYELPEHHWKLFEQGLFSTTTEHDLDACASFDQEVARLNDRRVRPASNVSWFDAVAFTQAWSNWLMDLDRNRVPEKPPYLPWEQGTPSYVRLPTEAEWEFAARGGVARQEGALDSSYLVRGSDGGATRAGALEEVAAVADVGGSRRTPLEPIGTKLPNLLGLHDIIGNVDEIVFDMFRLTRPDNLHGQPGGYVVKGGNVFTSRNTLSVSHRREVPFFDLRGERRSETTGFRPMLALPVFISAVGRDNRWQSGLQNPELMDAIQQARAQLARATDSDRGDLSERLTILQEEAAAGQMEVETLQGALTEIQRSLERSNTQLNERSKEVLRERFQTATLVALNIDSLGRNILGAHQQLKELRDNFTEDQLQPFKSRLDSFEQLVQEDEQSLNAAFSYYVSNIMTLSREEESAFGEAVTTMRDHMRRQDILTYDPYINLAERHVTELRNARGNVTPAMSRKWLDTLDETREFRAEHFSR